jgi:hypothetical protein
LLTALVEPACGVCAASAQAARIYLRGVLGDGVNDVDLRADWRRRGGLCPRHWRVWRALEAPAVSSAVLLRDLLEHEVRRRLGGSVALEPGGGRRWLGVWAGRRSPRAESPDAANTVRCSACELERKAERRYLNALQRLPQGDLEGVLAGGRGFVCVAHVDALTEGPRRALLTARLEALLADLDVFLRRSDHRFSHEPMGEAGDAWLRAIRAVGGDV